MRGRVRRTHICVGLAIHMYDGQYGGPSHVAAYCLRAAMLIIIASTSTAAVTRRVLGAANRDIPIMHYRCGVGAIQSSSEGFVALWVIAVFSLPI